MDGPPESSCPSNESRVKWSTCGPPGQHPERPPRSIRKSQFSGKGHQPGADPGRGPATLTFVKRKLPSTPCIMHAPVIVTNCFLCRIKSFKTEFLLQTGSSALTRTSTLEKLVVQQCERPPVTILPDVPQRPLTTSSGLEAGPGLVEAAGDTSNRLKSPVCHGRQ